MRRFVHDLWAWKLAQPDGMVDAGGAEVALPTAMFKNRGRKADWGFGEDWPPQRVRVTIEWLDAEGDE